MPTKRKRKWSKKWQAVAWNTLNRGDTILVKSGGPFILSNKGEKIKMGHRGIFRVHDVNADGIVGYGPKEGGFGFIYMGATHTNSIGITKQAHKIFKATS